MSVKDTGRRAVLIVDDNADNLRLLSGLLLKEGYDVRVALDGGFGLSSALSSPPDLILLDVKMPNMDGLEFCRRLKAAPGLLDIPVIFLSAQQATDDKLKGFAAGAVDYIGKPFVPEEVLARVQTHMLLRDLQRQLEDRVRDRTRSLQILLDGTRALSDCQTVAGLLERTVHSIVETGGYRAAWIGLSGTERAAAGDPAILQLGRRSGLFDPSAAEQGRATFIDVDALPPEWIDDGVRSVFVLPIFSSGREDGRCVILSSIESPFQREEEADLLTELAANLSYGVSALTAREEHARDRELLEHAMESTIQAVAATIEVRDAYTAGHQRRVAEICVALGRALGVSEKAIKGIYFAGLIHDIGKIRVPAEILTRPGQLSELELQIIRGHPEIGHDIIKGIEFPWPVSGIILQHHERLDGSGYPFGLKGDQILREARILAVADVLEAMSAHRPYRRGLGLSLALEELRLQRGSLYEPEIVDACLYLAEHNLLPQVGHVGAG